MKVSAEEFRLHDARSHKLGFLVPVLYRGRYLQCGYSNSGGDADYLANEGMEDFHPRSHKSGGRCLWESISVSA
jgi:hypothetical protein